MSLARPHTQESAPKTIPTEAYTSSVATPAGTPVQGVALQQTSSNKTGSKVGERFGKFTLLAKLATGGMAELFVARLNGASGFRKNVVIKRILPQAAHDQQFLAMFLDEAMTCANLNHPNICQVFEFCETQGTHFLVLEHLEGATVGDLIHRCIASGQQLDLSVTGGLLVQACDGLHAAHQQCDDTGNNIGLVHRDVSPGNLFVTVDGIVKVLDFGIAKANWMTRKTRTGTLLGKCEYMSPEQARGHAPIDRRSDIFSLGVIAWELLCGRRLFRRESEYKTLEAVMKAPVQAPKEIRKTIPEALNQVIMKALEKDPSDRYRNANDFRKDIAKALQSTGGVTPMCDIATMIGHTFAKELKMQRSILRQASQMVIRQEESGPCTPPMAPLSWTAPKTMSTAQQLCTTGAITDVISPVRQRAQSHSRTTTNEIRRQKIETPVISKNTVDALQEQTGTTSTEQTARLTLPPASGPIPSSASTADHDFLSYDQDHDLGNENFYIDSLKKPTNYRLLTFFAICGAFALAFFFTFESTQGTITEVRAPAHKNPDSTAAKPEPKPELEPEQPAVATTRADSASPILVMPLDDPSANLGPTGTLSLFSSVPASVYLYPEKNEIGTTPLIDFRLPAGKHKLKMTIGPDKGQRKYFLVNIKKGQHSKKTFTLWRK